MKTTPCSSALEHRASRRAFLGCAAGLLAGGTAGLDFLGSPVLADQLRKEQKRAILIFLAGGASQFETWDPKPGRPTGGPYQSIQTAVPGVRLCELMPEMAKRLHRYTAIIRSLSTQNTEHSGPLVEALMSGQRSDVGSLRTPSLGCLLARELSPPDSLLPANIDLGTLRDPATNVHKDAAVFLGGQFEPLRILGQLAPDASRLPTSLNDADHRARSELRDQLSRNFAAGRLRDASMVSHGTAYARVRGLMAQSHLFDISKEPAVIRDRYGHSLFGQQALVARRLVEGGVPFVRLTRGWWDSHGENFDIHAELVPDLDQVMSALLDDLDQRGLLRNTLVITFSEMGRTPNINNQRGRDHWGTCWSVTLSGCGVRGGAVYGSTNADGTAVAENKVTTAEFFATIFKALGIDHRKEYAAPDGRPLGLTPYNTRTIDAILT
ncbi:hypothetical protein AYO40_00395 [Planctomycetaceae bacterium SCGC AG-212-D15]|nr:hypothetical protein AYO40_00395 [Planctomycetaceae bacterium SCGC AG-212-D15]